MKITDYIRTLIGRRKNNLLTWGDAHSTFDWRLSNLRFGEVILLNAIDILTDIYNEVIWQSIVETQKAKAWVSFVNRHGLRILKQLLMSKGYAVIGYRLNDEGEWLFWQMRDKEYREERDDNNVYIVPKDDAVLCYVLKSPTFEATGHGDRWWCDPFVRYLDNILNGSNTISERMGVVVAASPKDPANAPMPTALDEEEKKELEKQLQNDYGHLSRQSIMMLLPRPMDFQTINLAGLDLRTAEKVKLAITAICDRIKVPANQVAMIDATSSRSLANGTELREGDIYKYRNFRRLLNATFYDFAAEIGLQMDYQIENEPLTTQGQSIEQ